MLTIFFEKNWKKIWISKLSENWIEKKSYHVRITHIIHSYQRVTILNIGTKWLTQNYFRFEISDVGKLINFFEVNVFLSDKKSDTNIENVLTLSPNLLLLKTLSDISLIWVTNIYSKLLMKILSQLFVKFISWLPTKKNKPFPNPLHFNQTPKLCG